MFIHHLGQFLQQDTKNSITEINRVEVLTYLNLVLRVSKTISTQSNPCNEYATLYDQCILNEYLDSLARTNSCLLPFIRKLPDQQINYCASYKNGMDSLKIFQNSSKTCLRSCLLVIPDLTLQLEDQFLKNSLTISVTSNMGDRVGLYLLLPNEVELMESKFGYSLFTALANILGVAGLFFGISAIGCLDIITAGLSKAGKMVGTNIPGFKHLKTFSMIMFGILSAGLVIWILIVFIEKYASSPVETSIAAEGGIPPMALAFCLSKYVNELDQNSMYLHSYSLTDNISFWQESSDIRNKVSSFDIMYSTGEWINIWNSSFPNGTDETLIFSQIIFPLNNQTLQFCHSYNLDPFIKKVTFKHMANLKKPGYKTLTIQITIFQCR
jgi:hypothetical protein